MIVDCVEPWILAVAVIVGLLVALLILVAASIVREEEEGYEIYLKSCSPHLWVMDTLRERRTRSCVSVGETFKKLMAV